VKQWCVLKQLRDKVGEIYKKYELKRKMEIEKMRKQWLGNALKRNFRRS